MKKADLLTVAHYLIGHLSCSQVPALAKRHKVEAKINSASAQELLVKVGAYPLPSRSRGDLRRNPLGTSVWSRFRIDGLKVLFCPSPANGPMIPLHEFKEFCRNKVALNHLVNVRSDIEAKHGRHMRRPVSRRVGTREVNRQEPLFKRHSAARQVELRALIFGATVVVLGPRSLS